MNSACSIVGNMLQYAPYLYGSKQQMYAALNPQANAANQQAAICGYAGISLQNLAPRKSKLQKAHEIAADVRARHPEMQVRRLESTDAS